MDDVLAEELFKQAEQAGAEDAVIVQNTCRERVDAIQNDSNGRPSPALNESNTVYFRCAVGDGECSVPLKTANGMLPVDEIKRMVHDACQAARLAQSWGMARKHRPFKSLYQDTPVQKCQNYRTSWRDEAFVTNRLCAQTEGFGDCLKNEEEDFAPILAELSSKVSQVSSAISLDAKQSICAVRSSIWLMSEYMSLTRYETTLTQVLKANRNSLQLPVYRIAGAGIDTTERTHQAMLRAGDVAANYMSCIQSKESFESYKGFGLILSPWSMAVIAHEAYHLGINPGTSSKITLDFDACLYAPPNPTRQCPDFSIQHSTTARPTMELMLARTPSHALMVDAPLRWARKNSRFLDVEFQIACEIIDGKVFRGFPKATLRFDLYDLWAQCTETSEPAQRISINCMGSWAICQAVWGYFYIAPKLVVL